MKRFLFPCLLMASSFLLALPIPAPAAWIHIPTGQIYQRPQRINLGPNSYPASVFSDPQTLAKLKIQPFKEDESATSKPKRFYRKTNPKDSLGPDGITIIRKYTLQPSMSLQDLRNRAISDLVLTCSEMLGHTNDDVLESLELGKPIPGKIVERRAAIRAYYKQTKQAIVAADYDTIVGMMPFNPPGSGGNGG